MTREDYLIKPEFNKIELSLYFLLVEIYYSSTWYDFV